MLGTILTAVGVIGIGFIAILVLLNNHKSASNRLFTLLITSLIIWSVLNYFSLNSAHPLLYIRLVMADAVVILASFCLSARVFPGVNFKVSIGVQYEAIYAIATVIVALSPWLFTGVKIDAMGKPNPVPGPGMLFFVGALLYYLPTGVFRLWSRAKSTVQLRTRLQIKLFLYVSVVLFSLIIATNFIMPLSFSNTSLVAYGPIFNLLFASFITYAILRHKLFDMRFFVVRALAYIISTVLLSLLCVAPTVWAVTAVVHIHLSWERLLVGVGAITVVALLYSHIHTAFNRLTSRIFFRSYYEPQDVLDKLSDLLVRTIDLDYLQKKSEEILRSAIRPNDFRFWLGELPKEIDSQLSTLFHKSKGSNVLVLDELVTDKPELVQRLHDDNIAVAVRLRTTHGNLGFVTLGFKESGEMYNERDKRLLSTSADEIAISLQNALHFAEIQDFNRTLQARVADATKELRRNNEKLRTLDETKDDFISMASHQLRTPLTSVKGYLSMVLEGDAGKISPVQRKMLGQAYISSQRMVYMIADLLNVSRLKTGKFVIEPIPTDLSSMVQEEIEQLVETAQSREIALHYDKPATFPQLMLDETKTRQVVMNFIDNAIYYTPAGGHIRVELADKPHAVELRVVDDGIGVPKGEQHHLFTKFYRAGNARKARPDGTGLGLFMAKKVVMAQGGSIIFDSQEGKGSTFGFSFPKSKLHAPPPTKSEPDKTAALAN